MIFIPLILSIGLVGGIFLGRIFFGGSISKEEEKLRTLLGLIQNEYVDEVSLDSLIDGTYAGLMSRLDPHSVYIPASDLEAVNDELEGSFSGVGVSFQIMNDTVNVIEIVAGGPAEKVGIMPGDKIIMVDTINMTGKNATNENVFKYLRGKKGTTVELKLKRSNSPKLLTYKVTRDDVPQNSVDTQYIISDGVGYIKVSKFARTTYDEFYKALQSLQSQGAKKFIIDLRGNSGGYMEQAIMMANEFLPKDRMIVYTKGKNRINESFAVSNGGGHFLDSEIVVVTDEFSASASEIFAGAIQDNDRGLVIGRRTFGKGLVQNQFPLPDNSAVRLTVARYFTPSGRSIQKEYKLGENGKYELDLTERYAHGEFYNVDSIKIDKSKVFTTTTGRTVYGGGGIMPDIFVPEDTVGMSSYYISVSNAGLIQQYAYNLSQKLRQQYGKINNINEFLSKLPENQTLLEDFVDFAASKGVPARWYYIRQSEHLILRQLKAIAARDILGYAQFIQLLNQEDKTIGEALEALKGGKSPLIINPIPQKK